MATLVCTPCTVFTGGKSRLIAQGKAQMGLVLRLFETFIRLPAVQPAENLRTSTAA